MTVSINKTFPLSHEQAVAILLEAEWDVAENLAIDHATREELVKSVGKAMCDAWGLDNRSYPLPRHYMKTYGLGDWGDIARLIIMDWIARRENYPIHLMDHVKEFQHHWLEQGLDPVTLLRLPKKDV